MWGPTTGAGREIGSLGDVAAGVELGRVIGVRVEIEGLRAGPLSEGPPSRRVGWGVVTVTGPEGRALGVGAGERRVMGERGEALTPRRSED